MTHKFPTFLQAHTSAHQPSCRRVAHVVKPKTFQRHAFKSRNSFGGSKRAFERLLPENKSSGFLASAKLFHLNSDPRGHLKLSLPSSLAFVGNSGNAVVGKVYVLNAKRNHLNRPEPCIEREYQKRFEGLTSIIFVARGQQGLFLILSGYGFALMLLGLLYQRIAVLEGAVAQPAVLYGDSEHAPEYFKFAVYAGDHPRLAIGFRGAESHSFEQSKIAVTDCPNFCNCPEVVNESVSLAPRVRIRPHPGLLDSLLIILSRNGVVLLVVVNELPHRERCAIDALLSLLLDVFQQVFNMLARLAFRAADRFAFSVVSFPAIISPRNASIDIPFAVVPEATSSRSRHNSRFNFQIQGGHEGITMSRDVTSACYNNGVLSAKSGAESVECHPVSRAVTRAGGVLLTSGSQVRVLLGSYLKSTLSSLSNLLLPYSASINAAESYSFGGFYMKSLGSAFGALEDALSNTANEDAETFHENPLLRELKKSVIRQEDELTLVLAKAFCEKHMKAQFPGQECIVYARVSTEQQALKSGLARQINVCSDYARFNDYWIVAVFCEVASGIDPLPVRATIERIALKRGALILCEDHSRWSRKGVEDIPPAYVRMVSECERRFTDTVGELLVAYRNSLLSTVNVAETPPS